MERAVQISMLSMYLLYILKTLKVRFSIVTDFSCVCAVPALHCSHRGQRSVYKLPAIGGGRLFSLVMKR